MAIPSSADPLALAQTGLGPFLWAEIGEQNNGMPLTFLSAMARKGVDPWKEADALAQLPRHAMIDALTRSIALMPLSQSALADAPTTAVRLSRLLLGRHVTAETAQPTSPGREAAAKLLPKTLFYGIMFAILMVNLLLATAPHSEAPQATPPALTQAK
jgi:hypothetical protein